MSLKTLIGWAELNEWTIAPRRIKSYDGWEVWWTVSKRGRMLCHPNGTIEAVLRDAVKNVLEKRAKKKVQR